MNTAISRPSTQTNPQQQTKAKPRNTCPPKPRDCGTKVEPQNPLRKPSEQPQKQKTKYENQNKKILLSIHAD